MTARSALRASVAQGREGRTVSEVFVCATDATPSALSSLRFAMRLAAASNAVLILLHVVEAIDERTHWYAPASRAEHQVYKRLLDRRVLAAERRLRQQLQAVSRLGSPAEVEIVVKPGVVVDTVIELALAREASLIVLGKGQTRRAIGPTAERIARLSSRPVVLVPVKWTRGARIRLPRPSAKARRPALRVAS